MQSTLDKFALIRHTIMSYITYFSLLFYGFPISLKDVFAETYCGRVHSERNLDQAHDLDTLLSLARECLKNEHDRRALVTDKCKTLLTLSSLLLGLVGILLPRRLSFSAAWMSFLLFLAILALLNAVVLLLVFFGIRSETIMSLNQEDVGLDGIDLKKSLINSYLLCEVSAKNRTDYLMDVYRSARLFFLVAFSLIVILFSMNFLSSSRNDPAENVISGLSGDCESLSIFCVVPGVIRAKQDQKASEGTGEG